VNQGGTEQLLVFVKFVTRNFAVQPAQTIIPVTSVETMIQRRSKMDSVYVKKDSIRQIRDVRLAIITAPNVLMITMNALNVMLHMN